jgi:hypothetical protein
VPISSKNGIHSLVHERWLRRIAIVHRLHRYIKEKVQNITIDTRVLFCQSIDRIVKYSYTYIPSDTWKPTILVNSSGFMILLHCCKLPSPQSTQYPVDWFLHSSPHTYLLLPVSDSCQKLRRHQSCFGCFSSPLLYYIQGETKTRQGCFASLLRNNE